MNKYNDTSIIHHAEVYSGVHTHIRLPDSLNIAALLEKLKKKHILLESPKQHFSGSLANMNMI
ncbi:hypothetical protein ACFPYJ_13000 [Paenibacillus solisilvae]|uniref:Uncharacterized protein n=1 Tax=Paenibacillus solisilvae TaxID=2486751 RepID=A0ABW0W0R2_9BACL